MTQSNSAIVAATRGRVLWLALAFLAGCENSTLAPTPTPVAEIATTVAASAEAPAVAPSSSSPIKTLILGPVGSVSANEAPPPQAGASAAAPAASGAAALPKAESGVLAKGEADKILPAGSPPKVRLLAPGKEPRAPLAYAFTAADQQAMTITLDMQMEMKAGERTLPQTAIPRMAMKMDLRTTEVAPSMDAKVLGELVGIGVEPNGKAQEAIAKAMEPHLTTMKGLSMSYWVSPHGAVRDMTVTLPKDAPAAAQQTLAGMNQSLESMVAPLPHDPVGIGGQWEVVTRVNNAGVDILQYATYTLKSRAAQRASIDVSVRQIAASDQVKVPGMPDGMTATLRAFTSSGAGSSEIDTGHVAPTKGAMKVRSTMTIAVGAALGAVGPAAESITIDSTLSVGYAATKKP